MERLSEMFPGSSYQTRLDAYLSTKGITDAAQLETYIRQFNSQKETYLWKTLSTLYSKAWSHGAKPLRNTVRAKHLITTIEAIMDIGLVAIQIIVFGAILLIYMAEEYALWEVPPISLDSEFYGWV